MGPFLTVIAMLVILIFGGQVVVRMVRDRRIRKELLLLIDELDAKFARLESSKNMTAWYQSIKEKLNRYR